MATNYSLMIACGAMVFTLLSTPAVGSEAPWIEEILVTAQHREEGIADVPIAISTVSGEDISRMSIRNLEEVSATMPGFHMYQSPAQSGINIRSIGAGASNQGIEQQVGLFVDGVYAGRDRIFQVPFLDVERVEVIKGPQTVILGKNTTAGAVNITTARPSRHFEAQLRGLYGDDGEYELVGIASGPLSDNVAARIAARASGMDGYLKNTFTGNDEPDIDDIAFRGSVLWQPTEVLDVLLKAEHARSRQDGNALVPALFTDEQLALARLFHPGTVADLDSQTKVADGALLPDKEEYNDLDSTNVTLTVDYSLDHWELTSISAFGALDYEQATDTEYLPIPTASVGLVTGSEFEQLSQELRFASPVGQPIELMGGLYYQRGDTKFLDWNPCVIFGPAAFCAPARWSQLQNTYSSFLRGTWNATDEFRVNVGLRYTYETKEAQNVLAVTELDGVTPNKDPISIATAEVVAGWIDHSIAKTKRTENSWSPSISTQYDLTPNTMVYASFIRGEKSGGFNPLNGTGDLDSWEFGPETARSYEVGAKARLFGGRAEVNFAGFMTKISDFQVSQFDGSTFIVTNAGSVEVDGIEVDFRWLAARDLSVSGAVSYIHSQYGTFENAPCMTQQAPEEGCIDGFQDLSGRTLPLAPDWTASLAADYARAIGRNLALNLQADVYYSDSQIMNVALDPRSEQPSYAKLNIRIGVGHADGTWEVAVVGKNVTDKITRKFQNTVVGFPGAFFADAARGRSLALQVSVNF